MEGIEIIFSVRLRHPNRKPLEFNLLTGRVPNVSLEVGQKIKNKNGLDLFYDNSYISYELYNCRVSNLEDIIQRANSEMMPFLSKFIEFHQSGGTTEYYLTYTLDKWHVFQLKVNIISELAKLGISLSIEALFKN